MEIVWVFSGVTESGDEVGPYIFNQEPPIEKVQEILMRDYPAEFELDEEYCSNSKFGFISQWYLDDVGIIEV